MYNNPAFSIIGVLFNLAGSATVTAFITTANNIVNLFGAAWVLKPDWEPLSHSHLGELRAGTAHKSVRACCLVLPVPHYFRQGAEEVVTGYGELEGDWDWD